MKEELSRESVKSLLAFPLLLSYSCNTQIEGANESIAAIDGRVAAIEGKDKVYEEEIKRLKAIFAESFDALSARVANLEKDMDTHRVVIQQLRDNVAELQAQFE